MGDYWYWLYRFYDLSEKQEVTCIFIPEEKKIVLKYIVYEDEFQIMQLILTYEYQDYHFISNQICSRWIDGVHDHFNYREHAYYEVILNIGKRWLRWAKRKRAARVIRRFYYDHVIPKLYNPHKEGKGFVMLREDLIKMNAASVI